jgi:hypothetical protein
VANECVDSPHRYAITPCSGVKRCANGMIVTLMAASGAPVRPCPPHPEAGNATFPYASSTSAKLAASNAVTMCGRIHSL